jgi:hypothetical protein
MGHYPTNGSMGGADGHFALELCIRENIDGGRSTEDGAFLPSRLFSFNPCLMTVRM